MTNDLERTLYGSWDESRDVADTLKDSLEGTFNLGYLMNGRVIDIGCGNGKILHELQKLYPATQFFGIDRDADIVEVARRNNPQADIRVGYFDSIPFEADMFDVAFSSKIFDYSGRGRMHQDFPGTFETVDLASETYRILRKGGVYFIYEPIEDDQAEPFRRIGFIPILDAWYSRVFQK